MSESNNAEEFLACFNKIEKGLKNKYNIRDNVGFTKLINDLYKKEPIIRENLDSLKSYASLRNAIVHNRDEDFIIAEPHTLVVVAIQRIESLILNPPKVIPMFQREVLSLESSDSIFDAIDKMFKNDFSQVPILENNKFVGLLNSNTITRWFGATTNKEIDSDGNTTIMGTEIKDVLNYTEINDNYKFVKREYSIQDVLKVFDENRSIEAILITHSGSENEKLIGIITICDLIEINKALDVELKF